MTEDEALKRIEALEAEVKALKAQAAKPAPAVEEEKPRKPWQPIDWTEGMRMPASAVKAMCDVVPDVRKPQSAEEVQSSWARTKVGEPGGFGPKEWQKPQQERQQRSEPQRPTPLEQPPGLRYIDQMLDAQDAVDRADLVKRIAGAIAMKAGGSK